MKLIGRADEIDKLDMMVRSGIPEFAVVYGRRRVGKTYLIREFFNYQFAFYVSGSTEAKTNKQKIAVFHNALKKYGCQERRVPQDWMEAFDRLRDILESNDVFRDPLTGRRIVFIDELPWFDTSRNDFRLALDLFWNTWASTQKDICLIICGSATSWIIKNMLLDRGGFHNRLTRQFHLKPFTLAECEEYLVSRNIELPRNQIIKLYMVFGGIPYYLNLLDSRLSLDQNIQALVFSEQGELHNEYKALFKALFDNPGNHTRIIEKMSEVRRGVTRAELSAMTGINNGAAMTDALVELEQCGFIREYMAYNKNSYGKLYQVIDPFVLFHNTLIERAKVTDWMHFNGTPAYYTWSGYAFETVCLNHTDQIKYVLGIGGISAKVYSWQGKAAGIRSGAQIDMLIDRADNTINICEMKYTEAPFVIDEHYNNVLINKRELFREAAKTRKALTIIMISASGVRRSGYYDILQRSISGDELFCF